MGMLFYLLSTIRAATVPTENLFTQSTNPQPKDNLKNNPSEPSQLTDLFSDSKERNTSKQNWSQKIFCCVKESDEDDSEENWGYLLTSIPIIGTKTDKAQPIGSENAIEFDSQHTGPINTTLMLPEQESDNTQTSFRGKSECELSTAQPNPLTKKKMDIFRAELEDLSACDTSGSSHASTEQCDGDQVDETTQVDKFGCLKEEPIYATINKNNKNKSKEKHQEEVA